MPLQDYGWDGRTEDIVDADSIAPSILPVFGDGGILGNLADVVSNLTGGDSTTEAFESALSGEDTVVASTGAADTSEGLVSFSFADGVNITDTGKTYLMWGAVAAAAWYLLK